MCGIAGFIGQGERSDLERMTDALAHRGPDGAGIWIEESVFLGHRRLAIVDLAAGTQPMSTLDGQLVITFNGEIYNHVELRRELEQLGHRFKTDHSDTEVLLYGYRQWGANLLDRLNGMWAFAIYDRAKGELFLCRDRFGKKPLYFFGDDRSFAFASELTALSLHPLVPKSTSTTGLKKLFAYGFVPAPHSLLDRVHKLPAGHYMTVSRAELRAASHKYWEFKIDPFEKVPKNPERDWGEELITRLSEAVRRRLQADVPVGVFLSGGIDSTLIATLATRHHPGIESFSIGFEDKSFDEREFARLAARSTGTTHHEEILFGGRCTAWGLETAEKLDEVFGDSSLLPTALVSRLARRRVTVALSGDGGDELFAGYDPFKGLRPARAYHAITPRRLHRALRSAVDRMPVSHANMSFDFKIKRMLRGLSYPREQWLPVWMAPLEVGEINALFGSKIDPENLYSEAIAAWNDDSARNDVDRATQFFVRLYLQDDILTKTDRASMIHHLEARAPFLDIDFVNFARRIPSSYKLRGERSKYILKSAARGLIPDAIIDRRKKGFGAPIGTWFRNDSLQLKVTSPPSELNWNWITRRLREHRSRIRDDRLMLWCAWMLQHSPLIRNESGAANSYALL
jgi:asparagine synthase (glutamine-hydrolysing)